MNELNAAIVNAAISILTVLIGMAAHSLRVWLDKKIGLASVKTLETIADTAIKAVEQIAEREGLKGEKKFNRAKEIVIQVLAQQGIVVSQMQINATLEAAVIAMNEGWNKQ